MWGTRWSRRDGGGLPPRGRPALPRKGKTGLEKKSDRYLLLYLSEGVYSRKRRRLVYQTRARESYTFYHAINNIDSRVNPLDGYQQCPGMH